MARKAICFLTMVFLIFLFCCSKDNHVHNSPSGLGYHAMAYDSESRRVILYAGQLDSLLGSWTMPVNLGKNINTENREFSPSVSPDGKYLFFVRDFGGEKGDIYWVDAKIIEELKKEELNREDGMNKITSILYVETIESCLGFWVDGLGFEKTAEVKDRDSLGFVILTSGKVEVMLQTYRSLEKDIPGIVDSLRGSPSVLYIDVDDINEIERRLKGFEVVVPRRKTFYGADEIYFRSPGGHIIGFSQHSS